MAIYTLHNVEFTASTSQIICEADIYKDIGSSDGAQYMQSFSHAFPIVYDDVALRLEVAKYAKNIVKYNALAGVFADAEVWLETVEWEYG